MNAERQRLEFYIFVRGPEIVNAADRQAVDARCHLVERGWIRRS